MTTLRLVAVLVMLAASGAYAEPVRVAVVSGVVVNVDAVTVDALSQDLAAVLTTELDVEVVGGIEVGRKLPADGLPPDCVTTPSCANDVARRTGATQLLFLVMIDTGSNAAIRIEATWIDPTTGQLAARPAIELTSTTEAEVRRKFTAAAHELLPDAPVRRAIVAVTVAAPPLVERRKLGTATLIVGGTAVLALGVAVVSGLETVSKYRACDRDPTCGGSDPRRATIRTLGYLADTTIAVATSAAIATVVLYATSRASRRVVVTPSAEGLALAISGRF